MSPKHSIERQLRNEGYRERRAGIFEAPYGRRVVAVVDADSSSVDWIARTNIVLRSDSLGATPVWGRYVVVTVSVEKTAALAAAAAAFCRDVSKCRRLVAFSGAMAGDVLPFIGLPATHGGRGTPEVDVVNEVRKALESDALSNAFLDAQVSVSTIQALAEDSHSLRP